MTQQDAVWLLEVYQPKKDLRIDSGTMANYFVPARRILNNDPSIGAPSCGCQFKAFVQITNSMFDQYKQNIIDTAYPEAHTVTKKKTARGRNKNQNKL